MSACMKPLICFGFGNRPAHIPIFRAERKMHASLTISFTSLANKLHNYTVFYLLQVHI